ncbi:MAG: hypothetical protein M1840_007407 [Geoglossum simile]|nr:MAG: hypothetical protein M1840_007407 [Geoglossum simile]
MQNLGRLVSLPLEKFHSATTASAEEPVRWVLHPQRDNLFCVLDIAEINNGQSKHRLLKVVSHAEVMEELDLDMLAQVEPVEGMGCSTHQGSTYQALVPDRNISAAVRPPLMAVKYRKSFGQFRLFQMRFSSDAGYQAALSALMQAHVPISLIANTPKSQTPTRQPWGSQGTARPTHRDALTHRGLAQHTPTSNVTHSTTLWGRANTPTITYANANPIDASQPLPHSRHTRLISTAPADIHSSLGPPQATMRNFRVGSAWTSPSLTVAPTRPEPRIYQAFGRNGNSFIEPQRPEPNLPYDEFFAPFRLPTMAPESSSSIRLPGVHSQQMSAPELPFDTPASALDFQQEMGLIMPPRRELPFAKPAQTRKPKTPHTEAKARLSISKLQLPELPKPTPRSLSKETATPREPSRGSSQSEAELSKESSGKPLLFRAPLGVLPSSPPTLRASSPKLMASLTPALQVGHHRTLPGSRLRRGDPESQSRDETVNPPSSTAETTPAPEQASPQAPLEDGDLRYMDNFLRKHMHYDQPTAPDDLSRLAGLPDKERQAEIDTMICNLIHDEDFYKLLEGVESSWQRIGIDLYK